VWRPITAVVSTTLHPWPASSVLWGCLPLSIWQILGQGQPLHHFTGHVSAPCVLHADFRSQHMHTLSMAAACWRPAYSTGCHGLVVHCSCPRHKGGGRSAALQAQCAASSSRLPQCGVMWSGDTPGTGSTPAGNLSQDPQGARMHQSVTHCCIWSMQHLLWSAGCRALQANTVGRTGPQPCNWVLPAVLLSLGFQSWLLPCSALSTTASCQHSLVSCREQGGPQV